MNGRLYKSFNEIPDKFNITGFSPGMFIYQLYNSEGVLLERGKLMVQ